MDYAILKQAALKHPKEILQPYDTLLGLEGVDAIFALTEQLGGMTVYVPNTRTIFSRCLELEARREFTGQNYAGLARKYGYTERHVRRMLGQP